MQDFRGLLVWKKSHELTLLTYELTSRFPRTEQFGLVSQMRRSSSSIPTNIAEGCGRSGNKEFSYFLNISLGSSAELEYQILLSSDLNYLSEHDHAIMNGKVVEIKKMLFALIAKVRKKDNPRKLKTEN